MLGLRELQQRVPVGANSAHNQLDQARILYRRYGSLQAMPPNLRQFFIQTIQGMDRGLRRQAGMAQPEASDAGAPELDVNVAQGFGV